MAAAGRYAQRTRDGVPSYNLADAIADAIVLILTAIVVIADRAVRRVKG